jgi:NADH dehydrogenase
MSRQGRLEVDAGLGIADHVFCIGDAAGVADRGQPLRMAVQFALTEGRLVGENLRRAQDGAPLRPYRPRDPGYIVPMAYGRACGLVLGRRLQGWPALLLHYLMCLVRTVGLAQKLRLLRSLKDGRG